MIRWTLLALCLFVPAACSQKGDAPSTQEKTGPVQLDPRASKPLIESALDVQKRATGRTMSLEDALNRSR